MKKWMYVCAAAMVTVSILAGCSGKSDSPSGQTQASQTAGTEKTEAPERSGQTESAAGTEAGDQRAEAGETAAQETETQGTEASSEDLQAAAGMHHVKITVKDYGTISVELDGDHAPITVANFLKLAKDGFYNGLTFHRIMSGFMIQGGDPLGTGMGGSDHEIKGEFSGNGVNNPLSHTRGAISMARSQDNNSASSQFFIVQEDSTFLDGQYACFGYVTDGMDVVDAICKDVKPVDNNGTVPKQDQPVIESVEVID